MIHTWMTQPLTGRRVLAWLTGFFGLIIATNVFFITEAVKTFRGEDEQKPYLQGMAYNHTLAMRAEQSRLGWRASIAAQRLNSGQVEILVHLRHPDGAPETQTRLTGELRHPADENHDRPLAFTQISPGLYQAQLRAAPGTWDVLVSSMQGTPFQATRRLWLR
jgi:nitrogen fixation protein FixH